METRLDNLVAKKENISRSRAQTLIKEDKVRVEGIIKNKPSLIIDETNEIAVDFGDNYVSRGAYKLKKAIEAFNVSLENKTVLDMGASTGGFTQVSLENGAKKVYSVDVGKGELSPVLAKDNRVVNMEGTDIRLLEKEQVKDCEIVVGDLSFISLTHILPKINSLFGNIECILLFKPQFECGKETAKKYRGVIKDKAIHKNLLKEFLAEIKSYGFTLSNLTYSPIKGKSGNIEYLIHFNGTAKNHFNIEKTVDEAFKCL